MKGEHTPFAHILDRGSLFVAPSVVLVNVEKDVAVKNEPDSPRRPPVGHRGVC